eukprot:CCRYP_018397-RA/>CCRYP_018397-RA protein AED:0.39 eAED:0.47 QI:0/0/0/1/0/0/2/0/108
MVMAWEQALRDHGNRNGNTRRRSTRKADQPSLTSESPDTDSKSYGNTASDKLLERFAQLKRDKYEEACLERHRHSPLCYSVDGMACKAARAAERPGAPAVCQVGSAVL